MTLEGPQDTMPLKWVERHIIMHTQAPQAWTRGCNELFGGHASSALLLHLKDSRLLK